MEGRRRRRRAPELLVHRAQLAGKLIVFVDSSDASDRLGAVRILLQRGFKVAERGLRVRREQGYGSQIGINLGAIRIQFKQAKEQCLSWEIRLLLHQK